ncbi:fluoride efflux transporter CrcB [Alphaproteobacteria bacterium]|mgnify:CR=1 FL=1|nr:fluoride efflux transporter CrcB [Alphaproteobacteria bacterium]
MMTLFYVGLGGALGSMARFGVGVMLKTTSTLGFPWASLSVNLLGSLAMGLVMGWLSRVGPYEGLRLFLAVGLLGGFTTFSAFSMELFGLLERREAFLAVVYASSSVVGGVAVFCLGYALVRSVLA